MFLVGHFHELKSLQSSLLVWVAFPIKGRIDITPCEGVKNGKPFGLLLSDMVTHSVDAIISITLPHAERNPDK